jgi:hypothetical protein
MREERGVVPRRRGRIVPLGAGFVAGLFLSVLTVVVGFTVAQRVFGEEGPRQAAGRLSLELTAWLVGSFGGTLLAQRLGAALSPLHAALFGLGFFGVNGLMVLPAPTSFLVVGALATAAASVAGARSMRLRPDAAEQTAGGPADQTSTGTMVVSTVTLLALAKEEKRRRDAGEPPLPHPPPRPRSFAERTGQARRLRVAQWLTAVGGAAIFISWTIKEAHGPAFALVGLAASAVGFVAQCLAVWCPRCRTSVVWHTFTTRRAAEAQLVATYQTACPECGYEPE